MLDTNTTIGTYEILTFTLFILIIKIEDMDFFKRKSIHWFITNK